MKKIILILLLISSPAFCYEHDPWTTQDTVLQLVYITTLSIDCLQTKSFIKEGRSESNPVLGKRPSQKKVNLFTLTIMSGHSAISFLLPKKYRPYWQIFFIMEESCSIIYNYKAGVKIKF